MTKKRKSKKKEKPVVSAFKWLTVAGIWFFIGITGLVAWHASDLPEILDSPHFERKAAITFYAENGEIIDRYGEMRGLSVHVEDLPPHLIYAVLATEDRRFYDHGGIDFSGLFRAMFANIKAGEVVQGGSTITQQLAKNLFLSHERTLERKIQEAVLALWLEHRLSKDEILSAYLNRVYMGGGAYGVDAASQLYFNKPATGVNLREAAILAGLLKAPSRYSPTSNPGLASKRARVVLNAMADAGYITAEEAKSATLNAPVPHKKPAETGSVHYFTDWIAAGLNQLIGSTTTDLDVKTTLDPYIQKAAETALSKYLRERGSEMNASQGAVIVMDHDGAVLAMVGGRDYGISEFNRATQALRPPGSSFKPIVYLTALEMGWRSDDMIEDAPLKIGKYKPQNYKNEYMGEVTLTEALALSLNTAAVRLAQQVGVPKVTATARRLGIHATLTPDLSIALGSNGIPMMEMVGAYAVLANGGRSVHPYAVENITDKDGKVIYRRMALNPGPAMFDQRALQDLDFMMQTVIREGTGRGAGLGDNIHAAGKTGTSQDFRDAWFIGYTDCCVAGVWVGNDDNTPMKNVTGGSIPARVWHDVMQEALRRRGQKNGWLTFPSFQPLEEERIPHQQENTAGFNGVLKRLFND